MTAALNAELVVTALQLACDRVQPMSGWAL